MKRLLWADSLKGFLILLVVLGHCIQYAPGMDYESDSLWNLIYSFHMSAFMCVSGYLNYRMEGMKDRPRLLWRRFQQLMVPFLIWSLVAACFSYPLVPSKFVHTVVHPETRFWFLWALFWVIVFFVGTDWVAEKLRVRQEYCEVAVALALVGTLVVTKFGLFGFNLIAHFFLFFLFGYFFRKYEDRLPKNAWLLVALTILWAVLAWLRPFDAGSVLYYPYRFATAFAICYVLLSIGPKLLNKPTWANNALASIGAVSLGIYVVHLLYCAALTGAIPTALGIDSPWLIVLIAFVAVFASAYCIVWLLNSNKYTARFLLGKLG